MDIKEKLLRSKLEREERRLKDKIVNDVLTKLGVLDIYYLGQLDIIKLLIEYTDICDDYLIAVFKGLAETEGVSETIKELANNLIEKYSKDFKGEGE